LQAVYNRSLEKSYDNNHIPHMLVISPIVELPFGKGRKWLNQGGILNAVAGGWQASVLGTLQKGSPVGPIVLNGARDLLGDQLATLRPNVTGTAPASSSLGQPATTVRGIQWLNAAAFSNPARYTYGNQSRTLNVMGPGIVNFDMMLAKSFNLSERMHVQFRWEAYNASNTPRWGNPDISFGSGTFGLVTSASSRRIMQLGLKLYW
jgi:hypothetical protein